MSSLDLLNTQEQAGGLFGAPYVPKDAWDIASEGVASMALPSSLGAMWDGNALSERDAEIEKRFGKSVDELTGVKSNLQSIRETGYSNDQIKKMRESKIDSLIEAGRKQNDKNWLGIKTSSEVRDEVSQLGKEQEERFSRSIQQANSTTAKVVGIGASALSSIITDPINLATLPFGASASLGMMRAIGLEALINAGIEAAEIPLYKQWADRVGRKYGVSEAALDIGTAGLGAGALTGIIRGVGALGRMALGTSMEKLDKLAASQNIGSDVKDAIKYQSRVAHVDEEMPWPPTKNIPERQQVAENRSALNETQSAFYNNRNPRYSETVQRFAAPLEKPRAEAPGFIVKPEDIIEFIIKRGGIKIGDANIGDIKLADLKVFNKGYSGALMKKKGKNLDDLREAAEEAGFLPPNSTVTDLINAIQDTAQGQHVFSVNDADEVVKYREGVSSTRGEDIIDSETGEVYKILKDQGVGGVSADEMRAIAKAHLQSKNPDETLEDAVADYLERQGMQEFDGLSDNQVSLVKKSQAESNAAIGKPRSQDIKEVEKALDEAVDPQVLAGLEARFAAMVKENPDEVVLNDLGQEVRLSDILDEFDELEEEVKAVKSCGVVL